MTILTPNGLILLAPVESPDHYFLVWQLKNQDSYLSNHPKGVEPFAWLNFEAEEYE